MNITFRQIEIFLAVVECGGFSTAGERLGMVQPAVSISVRKLEDALGLKLLDRSGGQVRETREGKVFLDHARALRAQLRALDERLKGYRAYEIGYIKIGAPPHLSAYLMPSILGAFLDRHGGIRITAVECSSAAVIQGVRSGEIDVGFFAGVHNIEGLERTIFRREPLVVCVSQGSPLLAQPSMTWSEILAQPLVLCPAPYTQRMVVDSIATRLGVTLNVAVESENGRMLTSMVSAGRGISVLFEAVVRETPGVAAIPIVDQPTVPVSVCRRKEAVPSLAGAALYDECAREAGKMPPIRGTYAF